MDDRTWLRHVVATLAYRGGKFLKNAPPEFALYDTGSGHTPLLILSHLGDLFDWALTHLRGEGKWVSADPDTWDGQVARFHERLGDLDAFLAGEAPIRCDAARFFQGPLADALTHVGQIAMLRRMTGSAVYGENYFVADIAVGRTGPEQAPPKRAF
ncbi:MAG: hypothetical protein ABIS67_04725 [Candidatus Eisenbacteria bacterium]